MRLVWDLLILPMKKFPKIHFFLLAIFFCCPLLSFEPVILLLGPPGSGKGTFAQFAKQRGYEHLGAGEIVRQEIGKGTALGREMEAALKKDSLVDSQVFCKIMKEQITLLKASEKPFIIDGFGRTTEDMQALFTMLSDLDLNDRVFVLFLETQNTVCKMRMLGRLICMECGYVCNTYTSSVAEKDLCPCCQNTLLGKRINDIPPIIEKRLVTYRQKTEKVYRTALERFPYLFFNTEKKEEDCLKFYAYLLEKIQEEAGPIEELLKQF